MDWRKNILAAKLNWFLFHTSKTEGPIPSFWTNYICVAQSQTKFENQRASTEVEKYFH